MPITTAVSSTNGGVPLTAALMEVYSEEVIQATLPILKFEAIATRRTELSKVPGDTINFLKYNALRGNNKLTENVPMLKHALSSTRIQLTVAEFGYSVGMTERLVKTTFDDVLTTAAHQLGQHYATHLDDLIRDELLLSPNVQYSMDRMGRTAIQSNDYFSTELVREAVEQLSINRAPKFNGDAYVCYIHPHQGRYLRLDPHWINASNYASPDNILTGEIGRFEDVRFIETTQVPYISRVDGTMYASGEPMLDINEAEITSNVYSSNTDVYRAVVVGDYAVGFGVALPVELRDDGVNDHGRDHALAYYSIHGVKRIMDGHTIVLETA